VRGVAQGDLRQFRSRDTDQEQVPRRQGALEASVWRPSGHLANTCSHCRRRPRVRHPCGATALGLVSCPAECRTSRVCQMMGLGAACASGSVTSTLGNPE
jgi:hypothetical protein